MEFGSERYYKNSGAAPFSGLILALVVSSLIGAVLGGLYGVLDWFNPYVKITFLGTLGAAAGTGFGVVFSLSVGKIRNRMLAVGIGAFAGLMAIYVAWVVFLYFWSKEIFGEGTFVFRPDHLVLTMQGIAQVGLWENMPKGGGLYTMWIIEATMFIGGSTLLAYFHNSPFCEYCNSWAEQHDCPAGLQVPQDLNALKRDLEDEQYSRLHELMQESHHPDNCLRMQIWMCPNCDESTWLTIAQHVTTTNSKGESSTSTTDVVKHLVIPRDLADELVSAIPSATGGAEALLTDIPESERAGAHAAGSDDEFGTPDENDENFWNTKKS